jgi:hypothetical protein
LLARYHLLAATSPQDNEAIPNNVATMLIPAPVERPLADLLHQFTHAQPYRLPHAHEDMLQCT